MQALKKHQHDATFFQGPHAMTPIPKPKAARRMRMPATVDLMCSTANLLTYNQGKGTVTVGRRKSHRNREWHHQLGSIHSAAWPHVPDKPHALHLLLLRDVHMAPTPPAERSRVVGAVLNAGMEGAGLSWQTLIVGAAKDVSSRSRLVRDAPRMIYEPKTLSG